MSGWSEGELVAHMPTTGCMQCAECAGGQPLRCKSKRTVGLARDGAFARFVRVPAFSCVRLHPGTDPVLAALLEPLSVGDNAAEVGEVGFGDTVLVLGPGTIGQAIARGASWRGAARVVVAGLNDAARLATARQIGVATGIHAVPSALDVASLVRNRQQIRSIMAEVYGRLTRKPGVVLGQGPWVLGNGLVGTIEARLSSSPMLLLTDFSDTPPFSLHGPYQSGTGEYGNWDVRQAFGGLVKQVFAVHEPTSAVHATQLAIKHALTGQPGPVAVIYSITALSGQVGPDSQPRLYPTQHYLPKPLPPADPAAVTAAARALHQARRPVLIAGNGVRLAAAYDGLRALAEAASLPVVSTPSGKGCLPETHPLALGVFGTFGTPAANACVAEADVVVVVGSKLTASDTARENPDLLDPERQVLIQIDVEPRNASWTFPVEHVLIGDAGIVMDQLRRALPAPRVSAGVDRVAQHRATHGHFDGPVYRSDASPVLPQRIIAELQRQLPDDAVICCDAGENRIFMTHAYQTRGAGTFLQAAGAGPMGYAIPAAMAAKLVHPDRTVVAVCGDGGFSMTMNGLLTAVEEDLPIVTVIFNNQALGWSMHSRGPFATRLGDFDYAAIARGMGCEGVRVTDPADLGPALQRAVASRKPTVIDVLTSLDISFDDMTSPLAKAVPAPRVD